MWKNWKCDVTQSLPPLPPVTNCHTFSDPLPPLERDILYGRPQSVFKMKSWNFTGSSATLRDRSWEGWRFYRIPTGVRNKGLITQKTWIWRLHSFAQFSRWRVEYSQERRWLFGTGRENGWRFYRSPIRVRNKGLITQKNVNSTCIRTVFKMKSWNLTGM